MKEKLGQIRGLEILARSYLAQAEGVKQGDAKSRSGIEDMINKDIAVKAFPHFKVTPEQNDSLVIRKGTEIAQFHRKDALDAFKGNPEGYINSAAREYDDQFAERYLIVSPVKIGEEKHDKVVDYHDRLLTLQQQIHTVSEDSSIKNVKSFTDKTEKAIRADVKEILGDDKKGLGRLVVDTYLTASPNEAVATARAVSARIAGRIDELLPEGQRAQYAARNLIAKANKDDKGLVEAYNSLFNVIG